MKRLTALLLSIVLLGACTPPRSSFRPQQMPPVQGAAHRVVSNERDLIETAVKVAESYWNAQKNADDAMFRSVTPHESMKVIFDWAYINKSNVIVESAAIAGIKAHLLKFNEHHGRYNRSNFRDASRRPELEAATAYATSIERGGYPLLGSLLKKGYWEAVIPATLADFGNYKLMNMQYIADIKAQSRAGLALQKRVTLDIYRMQADSFDSGWKVLFALGML